MATAKPKKPRALDIGRVIRAVDNREYNFYDNMTPEQLKEFSPYVLMRYISNARSRDRDINEWYIEMTNELVNKHHWTLSKNHQGLLWKLFAATGAGGEVYHEFLSMPKTSMDKFEKLLDELYPSMKMDEIKLMAKLMTPEDRRALFDDLGFDKKQRKDYE